MSRRKGEGQDGPIARTISVILGEAAYKLELVQLPTNSLDFDKPLVCPCCQRTLRIVTESEEHRQFEDKYTLLMACVPCIKAFLYNHVVSAIELADSVSPDA